MHILHIRIFFLTFSAPLFESRKMYEKKCEVFKIIILYLFECIFSILFNRIHYTTVSPVYYMKTEKKLSLLLLENPLNDIIYIYVIYENKTN